MGTLNYALEQVRNLKCGALPPELNFGLKSAVERTVAELRLDATALVTDADLGVLTLPVYYITRETLTNVHKHANANRVEIVINTDGYVIDLSITDNGDGGARSGIGAGARNSGLDGMHARIVELGGALSIESPIGMGTTVKASIPCVSS